METNPMQPADFLEPFRFNNDQQVSPPVAADAENTITDLESESSESEVSDSGSGGYAVPDSRSGTAYLPYQGCFSARASQSTITESRSASPDSDAELADEESLDDTADEHTIAVPCPVHQQTLNTGAEQNAITELHPEQALAIRVDTPEFPTNLATPLIQNVSGAARGSNRPRPPFQEVSTEAPMAPDADLGGLEPPMHEMLGLTNPSDVPTNLLSPPFQEVSTETLTALGADLRGLGPLSMRDDLGFMGPAMLLELDKVTLRAIDHVNAESVGDTLGHLSYPPTHLLVIRGLEGSVPSCTAIHAQVLAAYCAHLPPLPVAGQVFGTFIRLPVIFLVLPYPLAFHDLRNFLYTRDSFALLRTLLPCDPPPMFQTMPATLMNSAVQLFTSRLASLPNEALSNCLEKLMSLYCDVYTLGIFDADLWRVINLAWLMLATATKRQGVPLRFGPSNTGA